jgi:hypothetical protein
MDIEVRKLRYQGGFGFLDARITHALIHRDRRRDTVDVDGIDGEPALQGGDIDAGMPVVRNGGKAQSGH